MRKIPVDAVVTIFAVVLMALGLGFGIIHLNQRVEDSTAVTAECEVVDKYSKRRPRSSHSSYYIVLLFEKDQNKFEETIQISKESFNDDVKIGDMVLCDVTYDENGIINIEVADSALEQLSGEMQNYFFWVFSIFLLALAAITIIDLRPEKKKK